MSMTNLSDLIKTIKTTEAETFKNAYEGKSPASAWDADLPLDIEFRVEVASCKFDKSKASGRDQFVFTWEVVGPEEYAGKKFQEYVSPSPTNEAGSRQLADLLGALQANLEGWGNDQWNEFAAQFEGRTAVVALRRWGQNDDRIGIRYINLDRGQELRTGIKPPKPKNNRSAADLRPEINIPKDDPFPATTVTPPPAEEPKQATTPPLPGGINLPPGLS
jgi:hypothetical protein